MNCISVRIICKTVIWLWRHIYETTSTIYFLSAIWNVKKVNVKHSDQKTNPPSTVKWWIKCLNLQNHNKFKDIYILSKFFLSFFYSVAPSQNKYACYTCTDSHAQPLHSWRRSGCFTCVEDWRPHVYLMGRRLLLIKIIRVFERDDDECICQVINQMGSENPSNPLLPVCLSYI